ncbi:dihydrolipoyl dehydrogenase family protein [Bacillus sp. SCS-153A]|uniref:dihydrolipoyl dehydrogenase family protein n=1 Tax=Rossellomorea sedimentorum TaxID=3115294 RepID=UPI003906D2FA
MKEYDIVVIGGGAGGLTVAAGAASLGAKVALVEKQPLLGGDCLHYGCVPSKALINAARETYTMTKTANELGLSLHGQSDISIAMKRVKDAIAQIQDHDSKERFERLGISIYRGIGKFEDQHLVSIGDGRTIKGKRIVIATGSSPNIPPIDGLSSVPYLTNETIFDLDHTPKRMLVIGGGPVGLEMAQAFARFGTEVIVTERGPALFKKEDEEVARTIQSQLEKELTIKYNTETTKVRRKDSEMEAVLESGGQKETITVDQILVAAGRKANIASLNLEQIGVETSKGAIKVNQYLQSSIPTIFAIGDTNGTFPFTHAAGMEGKLVVRNALFGIKGKVNYENVPWVTYTDPEVFHLGETEEEAKTKYGNSIRTFTVDVKDTDRFAAEREDIGLVKIITDKKGKILGAHAVGKDAGDWMQEIIFAKTIGKKIGSISSVIHPYPTHGAILQQAADLYWREKLFNGRIPKLTKKFIQWFR